MLHGELVGTARFETKIEEAFALYDEPLRRCGLRLTRGSVTDADFVFLDTDYLVENGGCFTTEKPIILLDLLDACSIQWPVVREWLERDQVCGLIRHAVLREAHQNNEPTVNGGSYHMHVFNKRVGFEPEQTHLVQLSGRSISNIRLAPFNVESGRFRARQRFLLRMTGRWLLGLLASFRHDRYDVFFSGSTNYKRPIFTEHRRRCVAAVESLVRARAEVPKGHVPYKEFLGALSRSKITVSPWGYGEWCHRDFERILTETVVLKPDTEFVEFRPDIYIGNAALCGFSPTSRGSSATGRRGANKLGLPSDSSATESSLPVEPLQALPARRSSEDPDSRLAQLIAGNRLWSCSKGLS